MSPWRLRGQGIIFIICLALIFAVLINGDFSWKFIPTVFLALRIPYTIRRDCMREVLRKDYYSHDLT